MELKLGVIGLGQRGSSLLNNVLLKFGDVRITAVSDVFSDRVEKAVQDVYKAKGFKPAGTTDYFDVLKSPEVDAVLISAAWEMHAEMAVNAMEAGKITALEVGGAYSTEDCWKLVRTYEKTKTPFMFLENCCYDRSELLATSIVRSGLFGEIVHCSGSYGHDLRAEITGAPESKHYRLRNYISRNCDNYPTHQLGPISKILNINRGNSMVSLVSVASKAAGLKDYIKLKGDKINPALKDCQFRQGDIVITTITCANGETITLKLDTTLPRFYDREICVRGTRGMYMQTLNCVYLDGKHEEKYWTGYENAKDLLDNAVSFEEKYLPKIWKDITQEDILSGHGGMDAILLRQFTDCALSGRPMPIDVYDAAAWMSVSCLSGESISTGGSVAIPDFTGGKWLIREPQDVISLK